MADGGAPEPCRIEAVDGGSNGGSDTFRIFVGEAGATYTAGGSLSRGNVVLH